MRTWLVDTGPLVAYLDARDPSHDSIAARNEILTLDRRAFSVFRTRQGRPFRAVFDRRS